MIAINGIELFLPDRNATSKTMVDCIAYVRDLVGPDHVGVGLVYSPASVDAWINDHSEYWPPNQYANQGPSQNARPSQFQEIAARLLETGWSAEDTRKVLGETSCASPRRCGSDIAAVPPRSERRLFEGHAPQV